MKLGIDSVWALLAGIATIAIGSVSAAFVIDAKYEKADTAHEIHLALEKKDEVLANERELGELETELKLIELELKQLQYVEAQNPLNPSESF